MTDELTIGLVSVDRDSLKPVPLPEAYVMFRGRSQWFVTLPLCTWKSPAPVESIAKWIVCGTRVDIARERRFWIDDAISCDALLSALERM